MGIAKILIVDDKPANLLTLEELLQGPNVQLVRASSGDEALAYTLDHNFALVLLDVQMPGMDGYEVAELMRGNKKTKHIPIIFVTAEFTREAHIFKGYESGAIDYLFKPLDPLVFKSKVNVFLELHRHREALEENTREIDKRLVELEELQQQLEEKNEQLLLLSITDGLTGLINRRYFDELYDDEWRRCQRQHEPLSLLLLDIDHFKTFNDTYGHGAGDDCLKCVAEVLTTAVQRDIDRVARIGGEEFAILLPGTDTAGAEHVAERVRVAISAQELTHRHSDAFVRITISIGVATIIPSQDCSPRHLMEEADSALYAAKEKGRNCVSRSLVYAIGL